MPARRRRARASAVVIRSKASGVRRDPARVAHDAGEVGLGARHRRLPLGLGDGDGLVAQGVGEQRHPGGRDDRVGLEEAVQRARVDAVIARLPGGRGRAGWRHRWTGRRRRPASASVCRAPRPALRVAVGAGERHDDGERPAVGVGGRARGAHGVRELAGRVGVRPVAEHEVERAARRTWGRRASAAIRSIRSVGSIIGWARPRVSPSSPKSMTTWPASRRSGPSASVGSSGRCCCGCRRASASATVIASSARVPPQNSPRRAGPRARPGVLRGPPRWPATCGTGWPSAVEEGLDRGGEVGAARAEHGPVHRAARAPRHTPRPRRAPRRPAASTRRRPTSVAGSSASARSAWRVERPPTAALRSRPPTPRQWLTPDAGRVEQAHHLLGAGAGRRDDAHRSGPHDVGEAERDPADVGRAAVGAHDEHVGGGRGVLEPHLVLDGHVVGEQHHRQPRRDGVEGLGHRVLARAPR